jgi:hypothetical protein
MLRLQALFAPADENGYEYGCREEEGGTGETRRIVKVLCEAFPPHATRKIATEEIYRLWILSLRALFAASKHRREEERRSRRV